jgi:putative SOS response-associated peptidase YedK
MAFRLNVSNHTDLQSMLDGLGLRLAIAHFTPHFNVRPLSAVWGVTRNNQGAVLAPMQWGFVPPWAKDGQFWRPLTVARAETIHEKPSFRPLIARYRGILPINGYYEWRRTGGTRTAHYIRGAEGAMALATLCQMHGDGYHQCCVITTKSQGAMRAIHERQPLAIPIAQLDEWLFDDRPQVISKLLENHEPAHITPLENLVDNPQNDGPECLTPLQSSPNQGSS